MAKILIAYFSHAGQNYSHGGSGFSNSLNDIARFCPNATIKGGLAINGDDAAKVIRCLKNG
ncbi:MAG: hypothetical protein K2J95_08405 [Lachnospiraceae bacterium]|nr:hypothetical protein [Lachnospiraceae bacterium]